MFDENKKKQKKVLYYKENTNLSIRDDLVELLEKKHDLDGYLVLVYKKDKDGNQDIGAMSFSKDSILYLGEALIKSMLKNNQLAGIIQAATKTYQKVKKDYEFKKDDDDKESEKD